MLRLSLALLPISLMMAGCPLKQEVFDAVYGEWKYTCGTPKTKGQKCEHLEECAAPLFCDPMAKVCSDAILADGAVCELGSPACGTNAVCNQDAIVGTCVTAVCDASGSCTTGAPTGGTCDQGNADTACGAGRMCLLNYPTTGTCGERPIAGEQCHGPGSCAAGFHCDLGLSLCAADKALGAACTLHDQCGPNRFCLTASKTVADWQQPGTCQVDPKLPAGAPCLGDVCGPGLHCDYGTNTCARDVAVGGTCKNGNECGEDKSLAVECVRQQCVATTTRGANCWPGPGDRCTGDLACVGPR
jgi:hypothetical protein